MKYSQFFKQITRDNGDRIVVRTDDAPENLRALCQAIHFDYFFGCLPNDWIYSVIKEAFEDFEDYDDTEWQDMVAPDIYNSELMGWLYNNGNAFAVHYCNEAMDTCEDLGTDIVRVIGAGQYEAKMRIYGAVNDFITGGSDGK